MRRDPPDNRPSSGGPIPSRDAADGHERPRGVLHLVLRSPADPGAVNVSWMDDDCVAWIKTHRQLATRCAIAYAAEAPVRIHRRAIGHQPAVVCCECYVKAVTAYEMGYLIEFHRWRVLRLPRDIPPHKRWYVADPAGE
jgi:hypothetical protein